jgi:hypothetical protein
VTDHLRIPYKLARHVVIETREVNDLRFVLIAEHYRNHGSTMFTEASLSAIGAMKRGTITAVEDRLRDLCAYPVAAPNLRFNVWEAGKPPLQISWSNARSVELFWSDEWKARGEAPYVVLPVEAVQRLNSRFSLALYMRGIAVLTDEIEGARLEKGVMELKPSQLPLLAGKLADARPSDVVANLTGAVEEINRLSIGLRIDDFIVEYDAPKSRRRRVVKVRFRFKRIHAESYAATESAKRSLAAKLAHDKQLAANPPVVSTIPGRPSARPSSRPVPRVVALDVSSDQVDGKDPTSDSLSTACDPSPAAVAGSAIGDPDPDDGIVSTFAVEETLTLATYRASAPMLSRNYDALRGLSTDDQWRLARKVAERELPVLGAEKLPDFTADPAHVARVVKDQASRSVFNARAHTRAFDILAAIGASNPIGEDDDGELIAD